MSHTNENSGLDGVRACRSASAVTHRHLLVALWLSPVFLGCMTGPERKGGADSIDVVMPGGERVFLDAFRGRVLVLDVCASWASACNVNARVLDEVRAALPDPGLEVVTMLLDEGPFGAAALKSYADTLGVQHLVVLAGSRVRAGTSALGDATYVPRLVILDVAGRIVVDESGGVISVAGVVERVKPLLPSSAAK
jgi:hypothetical protein